MGTGDAGKYALEIINSILLVNLKYISILLLQVLGNPLANQKYTALILLIF